MGADPPMDPDTVIMMLSDLPMGAAKFVLSRVQAKGDSINDPMGFIEAKACEQREALAKKQAKQAQKEANIAAEAQRQALAAARKSGVTGDALTQQPLLQEMAVRALG